MRIDGRGLTDIRRLSAEAHVLPRVHGSALFERGETQILGVTTLNMLRMEQMLDTLNPERTKRYMHNYNFPPYSTGETGRVGSPKRREIGHGALAERALLPVLPEPGGVPVRDPAGVRGDRVQRLHLDGLGVRVHHVAAGRRRAAQGHGVRHRHGPDQRGRSQYVTLTDILGAEDAFGDMDFKVAGTSDIITALQLDTKLDGIPAAVLAAALKQARGARLTILDVMREAIDAPGEMSPHAPRIITIKVPVDKIGEVIGPKGKMINSIQEETGAEITIEDDGTIYIGATDGPSAEAARTTINAIANPHMPEVGERFLGTVVKTTTFGAFISLLPGKDGLLHITQLRKLHGGGRIENVDDVVKVGDKIQVEIREIDDRGKLSLVPVEVVEREAAAAAAGGDGGSPNGDGALATRDRVTGTAVTATGAGGGPAADGDSHRTRHASAGTASNVLSMADTRAGAAAVTPRRGPATVLPGGLRVITESAARTCGRPRSASGRASGRATRTPTHAGATHYLEHLLFKGTRQRTALEISAAMDAVGGELNAFTAKEYTCYYARVLDADLPLAIDVLCDMVTELADRGQGRGRRARRDPRRDRHERRRSLGTRCTRRSPAQLFGDTRSAGRSSARVDTINAMTRAQIAGTTGAGTPPGRPGGGRRRQPGPRRGGRGRSAARVRPALDRAGRTRRRRGWPAGHRRAGAAAAGTGALVSRAHRAGQPGAGLRGPGRAPTTAGSRSACSTRRSAAACPRRLFQEVREKRGLAYSVYSFTTQHADSGIWGMYAGCLPAKADEVLAICRDEMAKVVAAA